MYYLFSHQAPIVFTIGGKFVSSTEWQHEDKHFNDYEVVIGLQDIVYLKVNDEYFMVHPHEVLLVPYPSHVCGYQKTDHVAFFWLHFTVKTNSVVVKDYTAMQLQKELKTTLHKNFVLPTKFKLIDMQEISILIYQLLGKQGGDAFSFEENNYLMTYLLLKISGQYLQVFNRQNKNGDDIRMLHIKNWVKANMSVHLRVTNIAEAFGLTPQYLSKLFKKQTGETLITYINQQKIKVARELLLRTTLSIKQISIFSYFKNEKQFFFQFKKLTGATPSHYRQIYGPIHINNPYVDPELPIPKEALRQIQNESKRSTNN